MARRALLLALLLLPGLAHAASPLPATGVQAASEQEPSGAPLMLLLLVGALLLAGLALRPGR